MQTSGSLRDMVGLAPFLSGDMLSRLATEKLRQGGSIRDLLPLLPFMDSGLLGDLIKKR